MDTLTAIVILWLGAMALLGWLCWLGMRDDG